MEDSSNIFPGLDQDTQNALIASEKNWNSDFKGDGPGVVVQKALNTVDFTAKLPIFVTYVVSYVTEIVTSYMATATADMLSIDTSQIISNAAKKLPNFIKGPAEVMGELLKDSEDTNAELQKKNEENLVNNLNKEIGNQVSKLTNGIDVNLGKVGETIENIGQYAYMGPVWFKSKIDLETKKIIENCCKQIASVRDSVKNDTQKQIDTLAEGLAQKKADQANQKTQESAKNTINDANKKKAQAMTMAKTAITNVKLKLMALIGG